MHFLRVYVFYWFYFSTAVMYLVAILNLLSDRKTMIYFLGILGIASMILQIDVIYLISQTCNVLEICDGGELPNCDVLLDFNDIMRTIFCVLYMHYFVKYDKNNLGGWKGYNLYEKIIIVVPYITVLLSVFAVAYVSVFRVALSSNERIIFAVMSVGSYLVYLGACMSDWYDWLNDDDSFHGEINVTHNTYTSTILGGLQGDRECLIMTDLSTRWNPKKEKKTPLQSEYPIPTFKITQSAMNILLETAASSKLQHEMAV